jgi:hypothetical protein
VFSPEFVTTVLHALATGYVDRALNAVATWEDLSEDARSVLWAALSEDVERSDRARLFGDALRSLGAERELVNECYRVAFHAGEEWKELSRNPLYAFFAANRGGRPLDKWAHYFPIYERHLARYRGRPVRVLEIGVYRGGGLDLLRHYLGDEARIVGLDIDEAARLSVGDRYPVEIGDQGDPDVLARLSERHGPFDIVIDDGGHRTRQQIVSVETLFPLLNDDGVYIVEDCHTSYWPEYRDEGESSFVDWVKTRVDDLHAYHFSTDQKLGDPWQTHLSGVHAYDSIVVLDKARRSAPFSELSGGGEFIAQSRQASLSNFEMLATRDAALAAKEEAEVQAALVADQAAIAVLGSREELRILRGELVQAKQGVAELRADLEATREELEDANGKLLGSWGIIQEMRQSASWKATAPLRRAKAIVRRR